jgi:predicted peptidase
MNRARRRLMLSAATAVAGCATTVPTLPGQHANQLEIDVHWRARMRLWLYLPPGYETSANAWPALVFLHGSGERGRDLERVKAHGPPKLIAQGRTFPFIVVSPQADDDDAWDAHALHGLLETLKARLRIDADRVCATGLSMGGHGVWNWATTYPFDLAAIAPVCGYGDDLRACRMRSVPVRAHHGADDTVVPLAAQQKMVDALRACGGAAELIVYPGVGHDAWNRAYEDEALYRWLLAQRRRKIKSSSVTTTDPCSADCTRCG